MDLGAHAGQRPGLLHRLGPRRAHLGQSRLSDLLERGIRWAVGRSIRHRRAGLVRTAAEDDAAGERSSSRSSTWTRQEDSATTRQARRQGEPLSEMQLPLSPAESMKHLSRRPASKSNCSPPSRRLGGKPICMNWDERGRLWVADTVDYPNESAAGGARATTASSSARTPTATAGPTSSPSSPTS